jgi:hypothetical protein
MYGYDTETMAWDEIPEDIKEFLLADQDFIDWIERYGEEPEQGELL